MKLFYSELDEKVKSIQDKMEEMVVSHEMIQKEKLEKPRLEFGSEKVEGLDSILKYLEDLHQDMQKGYYCAC